MDSPETRFRRSLQRAKEIAQTYALEIEDVASLSPKFWKLHSHPILGLDGAVCTLVTIQLNLVAGTLAMHAESQPHLKDILKRLLTFDVSGQFCLTELDHGLDAINLETTATLDEDGSFILNTPHPGAAKFMPPTGPYGIPVVAIVFARVVSGTQGDLGIRGFLVELNDGNRMLPGISAKVLPARGGAKPVLHCLTSFHKLRLPASSLLGSFDTSKARRTDFFEQIYRVAVGTLSISGPAVQQLSRMACVVARYSQRRTSTGGIPIIAYRTQYGSILTSLAQFFVLDAFWAEATNYFSDVSNDFWRRHGVATAFKVVTIQHAEASAIALSGQCGAQGLFGFNGLAGTFEDLRGVAIAEGDILGISIRLASEILLGRYTLPSPFDEQGLLAEREKHLVSQAKTILSKTDHHRSDEFNRLILPRCTVIVQSIGHRMAYEAACKAGLDPIITKLYLASIIQLDSAWFSEHGSLKAEEQFTMLDEALSAALPCLEDWLEQSGIEGYLDHPLLSDARWDAFVEALPYAPSTSSKENHGLINARL